MNRRVPDHLPLPPVLDFISTVKVNVYIAIKDVFLTLIYPVKVGLACVLHNHTVKNILLGDMCPTKAVLYVE